MRGRKSVGGEGGSYLSPARTPRGGSGWREIAWAVFLAGWRQRLGLGGDGRTAPGTLGMRTWRGDGVETARPASTDGDEPAGMLGDGRDEQAQEAGEHEGFEEGPGIGCSQCTLSEYRWQGVEVGEWRLANRSDGGLGMVERSG